MQAFRALAIVLTVHAITYALVVFLPNAAIIALGLAGGNVAAVQEYWRARPTPSYPDAAFGLLRGDLGTTLDRVPVVVELGGAFAASAPWMFASLAIAGALTLWLTKPRKFNAPRQLQVFETLAFLPPFIFPFLGAPLLFATPLVSSEAAARVLLVACIVFPATAMMASILLRNFIAERILPVSDKLFLNGVPESDIERIARSAAAVRLLGVGDRTVVLAFVSAMLAEPLLSLPGIGTLTARAVRTADPSLTVGVTTTIAAVVVAAGLISQWMRTWYVAYAPRYG